MGNFKMKLSKFIYTLCWMSMAAVPVMAQQQDSTSMKNKYFNAKDYLLQDRYIPGGKPFDRKAKGKNLSIGVYGGVS